MKKSHHFLRHFLMIYGLLHAQVELGNHFILSFLHVKPRRRNIDKVVMFRFQLV